MGKISRLRLADHRGTKAEPARTGGVTAAELAVLTGRQEDPKKKDAPDSSRPDAKK